MKFNETYREISELNDEEKPGRRYYEATGEYLSYIDLIFLKQKGGEADFSLLKSREAEAFRAGIKSKLEGDFSGVLREQIFIAPGINAEIERLPRYIDIPPHRHDFFEIVCAVKGKCLHRIEDSEAFMEQGDVTIIPPNVRHYLRAEPECVTFTIKIRKTTFDSVFSVLMRSGTTLSAYFTQTLYSKHYKNSLTFHCRDDAFIPELLLYMLTQQNEKKRHYSYVMEGLLATFFPYLVQNYEHTIELAKGDNVLNERMTAIESYMRQNYRTATLNSTAAHFYLSPSYLSTMVKRQTGYMFSAIMQKIRMEHAARLLQETDMKVGQICEYIGYRDPTQFIRTFKSHYGTTPHRFRAIHKAADSSGKATP